MSDTPIMDAVDAAYRKRRCIDEPVKDDRSPEQIEADRRKNAERRIENAGARDRREAGKRYARVCRALVNATTTYLKHGEALDAIDRAALTKRVVKDLGGDLSAGAREAVREFVDTAADAVAGGDKATGFRAADTIAQTIASDVDSWRPASRFADDGSDDTPIADVVDSIPRTGI